MFPKPTFGVDFNEMIDDCTVLLSAGDTRLDMSGIEVRLYEGLPVCVCMEDLDASGFRDDLVANGIASRNTSDGWSAHVKWCCRIDGTGIRRQSEVGPADEM